MKRAIVAGPDEGELAGSLEAAGADVERIDGPITTSVLHEAGIGDTDLFVLTDLEEATSIPIVRELHESVRIVVFAAGSIPEFATHQADLVLSPGTLDDALVVEALLDAAQNG